MNLDKLFTDITPNASIFFAFFMLAYFAALIMFWFECKRSDLTKLDAILLPTLLTSIGWFGTIILYAFEHNAWQEKLANPWHGIRFGSTQYGAIYAGIIVFCTYSWVRKIPLLRLFDLGIPSVTLALGVGRFGCFFGGCCLGKPLPLEWQLPTFFPSYQYFPASLLTAFMNLGIATFLTTRPINNRPPGGRLMWFFILTTTERFLAEFVRITQPVALGLSLVQWMAIPLFMCGVVIMLWRRSAAL